MLAELDKKIMIHLQEHNAITIKQCQRLFYKESEHGYDYARLKLKRLENIEELKSYQNSITKQKVYYINKKLSAHDLFRLDFYSKLVEKGCHIMQYKKTPRYLNNNLIPDAFIIFEYNKLVYLVLLEVDYTHCTNISRMQMYEKLYREVDVKKEFYGKFPQIVIMGLNPLKYLSKQFEVVQIGLDLKGFNNVISLT